MGFCLWCQREYDFYGRQIGPRIPKPENEQNMKFGICQQCSDREIHKNLAALEISLRKTLDKKTRHEV